MAKKARIAPALIVLLAAFAIAFTAGQAGAIKHPIPPPTCSTPGGPCIYDYHCGVGCICNKPAGTCWGP